MADALTRSLGLLAALDPRALALLVLVCAIGEFAIGIPYVLESIWLLTGYYLGAHTLSIWRMLALWLLAQCGRQAGSISLYYIAGLGTRTATRLDRRIHLSRLIPRAVLNSSVLDRVSRPSPFSIALCRLLGLRVPVALVSAGRHKLKPLLIGVLLSSVAWDAVYISVGLIVGTKASLKPVEMLLASLIGLTLVYLVTFAVRRLVKHLKPAAAAPSRSTEA